jgi:hypothetical protein
MCRRLQRKDGFDKALFQSLDFDRVLLDEIAQCNPPTAFSEMIRAPDSP